MITGHRFRILFYFAALVLCLSVCFAYAEKPAAVTAADANTADLPTSSVSPLPLQTLVVAPVTQSRSHLLFYGTPGRTTFLPALTINLVVAKAEAPVIPAHADATLQSLMAAQNHTHGRLHSLLSGRRKLKLVTVRANATANGQASASALAASELNATAEQEAQ